MEVRSLFFNVYKKYEVNRREDMKNDRNKFGALGVKSSMQNI